MKPIGFRIGGAELLSRIDWQTIEELDYSRLQTILPADYEKSVLLDQSLQHLGSMS
jgi:hypothetical protein